MKRQRMHLWLVLGLFTAAGIAGWAPTRAVQRPASVRPTQPGKADAQRPKAYLAGPLGFSDAGRAFHNGTIVKLVRDAGFEPLDPWTLTPQSLIDHAKEPQSCDERMRRWHDLNPKIGRNNADAIRASQAVVAVLDGSDVDSGTAAEIGYAAALGKVILAYRGDFRLSGDNEGAVVNLQVEYFIRQSPGGDIFKTVVELRQALVRLRTQLSRGGGHG